MLQCDAFMDVIESRRCSVMNVNQVITQVYISPILRSQCISLQNFLQLSWNFYSRYIIS